MAINIFNFFKIPHKSQKEIPNSVWKNPLYFIAFGLGSGALPFAPGTFGTLFAIPFYLLLQPLSLFAYISFVIIFILFSMWLCDYVSRQIKIHDHPGMCIDEFAGFFVTMIGAPHGWQWILCGFLLFRLFDIWKPWPISLADKKIHGGIGMVLDDILAGIYALVMMQILLLLSL